MKFREYLNEKELVSIALLKNLPDGGKIGPYIEKDGKKVINIAKKMGIKLVQKAHGYEHGKVFLYKR